MKPVKYFVKSVAHTDDGRIRHQQVLTPAMATEDQAFDYLNWLLGTDEGSRVRCLVKEYLEDDAGYLIVSVNFIKFGTTLY